MIYTIINILLLSIAIFLVSKMLPTIHIKSFGTAVIVAIVYSFINFLVGWLLIFLSLPFMLITLGLFKFVVNAILLWMTDKVVDDFRIDGFGSTLIAAFLITLTDSFLRWIL